MKTLDTMWDVYYLTKEAAQQGWHYKHKEKFDMTGIIFYNHHGS